MPADELKQAAQIHRRWRGLGAVLFVAFYSFFFSMHLKLEKSALYLHDRSVLPASTASFFNDLVLPKEHAGAGGTGQGSAFLLLHHAPTRLLVAAWKPFSDDSAARKHAVATLTATAGAMTVVLLYLTLMWSGVARLRAALTASVLGATTAMSVIPVIPQPQVFSALGLMAVLAAVARGRAGRWWEFPLAAGYALCCSPWNAVPVALMGLVGGARAFRGGGGMRAIWGLLGGAFVLALLIFGMMTMQQWLYPRTVMALPALIESWRQTFAQVVAESARANGYLMVFDPVFGAVLRTAEESMMTWIVVLGWTLIGLLAFTGLFGAVRRLPLTISAALLAWGWCIWFYGSSVSAMDRMHATPLLICLVGIGLEQYVKWRKGLRWPVTCLLAIFLVLLFQHNALFIDTLANPEKL